MREELEALVADYLDGTLDPAGRERLARELESDPAARSEFADQLRIHHRLGVTLEETASLLPDSVVREIRYQGDSERFSRSVVKEIRPNPFKRRLLEIVAAGFALVLLGFLLLKGNGDPVPAAAGRTTVLLVVGRLPLDLGDVRVKERLESLGFQVIAKSARDVQSSDAAGKSMVALSSTSSVIELSRDLPSKFRDASVPLLVWEPRLFHELGMIPASVNHKDWGALKEQTRVVIAAPTHALAAGLSQTVRITSVPAQYTWGRVGADAIKVATLEGNPDHAVVFGYESGRVAPARRVGLFLFDTTALHLTSEGWALFDAAVRWSVQP